MPKPTCVQCNTNDSFLWRSEDDGQICNDCYVANISSKENETTVKTEIDDRNEEDLEAEPTPAKATGKGTRKSTRATRYKSKTPSTNVSKQPTNRGRGRRSLFKRVPLKTPSDTPTVVTTNSMYYEGKYIQVGDIVSMKGMDNKTYFAQIRGLMTDQFCEKSAVITWLLPTKTSPPAHVKFDPSTYIIGPEEDLPRKLEVMDFVMHAPSDYYKASNTPYPLIDNEVNSYNGFVWTSLEAVDLP